MSQKERFVTAAVLGLIAIFAGSDILTDSRQGVSLWHLLVEGAIGLGSAFGIFYLLRGNISLRHRLTEEIAHFSSFKLQAEEWRRESRKYVDGLSKAIDQQLTKWNLTVAEREVAFLLLKGLSLKDIAVVRNTTEKTARVQSMAIYAKAGLAGRSELSAFFLEDLLMPSESATSPDAQLTSSQTVHGALNQSNR